VKSHKEQGYQAIVRNVEQGQATLGAALLVRADSGIDSIADLKGKKIVFGGDRTAMQAYVTATYLLRRGGLRKGDYLEEFAKNPPNAVMAVHFKQADAAGAGDHVLAMPMLAKQIDTSQLKYLVKGEPLPHLPWAVKGSMAPDLRQVIQQAMTQLNRSPEGQAILRQMGYDGFLPTSDGDYDKHRHIISEVLGEAY
jgi:phosphonate transport system substrate-binding protein